MYLAARLALEPLTFTGTPHPPAEQIVPRRKSVNSLIMTVCCASSPTEMRTHFLYQVTEFYHARAGTEGAGAATGHLDRRWSAGLHPAWNPHCRWRSRCLPPGTQKHLHRCSQSWPLQGRSRWTLPLKRFKIILKYPKAWLYLNHVHINIYDLTLNSYSLGVIGKWMKD